MNGMFVDGLPEETIRLGWFILYPDAGFKTVLETGYVDLEIEFHPKYSALLRVFLQEGAFVEDTRREELYRFIGAQAVFLDSDSQETLHFCEVWGYLKTSVTHVGTVAGSISMRHPDASSGKFSETA